MRACWCGNTDLKPFGRQYRRCDVCETLVSESGLSDAELVVENDDVDFYGKQYWLDHQNKDVEFPDIHKRARTDLSERALYWLKVLLNFKLPPASVLEIGCSHGGFVALMQQTGYNAVGMELSPWVVSFARETFGVPIEVGPIEKLNEPASARDVIAAMDVIEHLSDPYETLRLCGEKLRPDGIFLIQTPCYPAGTTLDELINQQHRFLDMLLPREHLYLFSQASIQKLFASFGFEYSSFVDAIFSHYDMFFIASRRKIRTLPNKKIEDALQASGKARLVQAMIDLSHERETLAVQVKELTLYQTGAASQKEKLEKLLIESEVDRAARLQQIEILGKQLKESEADRAARLVQIETLGQLIRELEVGTPSRGAHKQHLQEINFLREQLEVSEADRAARLQQISILTEQLKTSESDRADRLQQVHTLAELLESSEADRAARLQQINILSEQLKTAEADRAARLEQIEILGQQLAIADADRTSRLEQIGPLLRTISTLEADRVEQLSALQLLSNRLLDAETDRQSRLSQVEYLHAQLLQSEKDRAARLEKIEELGQELAVADFDRTERLNQVKKLHSDLSSILKEREKLSARVQVLSDEFILIENKFESSLKEISEINVLLPQLRDDRFERDSEIQAIILGIEAMQTEQENNIGRASHIIAKIDELDKAYTKLSLEYSRIVSELSKVPRPFRLAFSELYNALGQLKLLFNYRSLILRRPLYVRSQQLRRIAIDLTPILPGGENGGAKIFVLELVRQLGRLYPATQFILLTSDRSHDELAVLDSPNISRQLALSSSKRGDKFERVVHGLLRRIPSRLRGHATRLGFGLYNKIKRLRAKNVVQKKYDLLFCPFTAPTFYDPLIPTVSTIYDLQYKTFPDFFSFQDVAQRDLTFREACQKASILAAISNYSRETAIQHGAKPERTRTIYLQMAQRVASFILAPLDRLGLQSHRYFIYPANFWKHKNHEMLLTAFSMACARGLEGDLKLVLTGAPGARRDELMVAAARLGVGERVVFAGYLEEAEFSGLLAESFALIFPSLYEGFGLPVVEAMATGIPVACSNVTSLPEIAADAALLFDPRIPDEICGAILTLASDQAQRAHLVVAGKERAQQFFDAEKMAREYWGVFLQALSTTNHVTSLVGVYDDGWCSSQIILLLNTDLGVRQVELSMHCPDWIPVSKVQIVACDKDSSTIASTEVARGERRTWSVSLHQGISILFFRLQVGFVPAFLGLGNDHRELTLKLEEFVLKDGDGQRTVVFSVPQQAGSS